MAEFADHDAIENRPECYGCHDPTARLDGVLLTDFSMSALTGTWRPTRDSVLWSFARCCSLYAINFMMSKLVVTKLEQFVKTIKRFGRGDLGERVTLQSGDEIGELADAFNRMADGLQTKERENRQLYDELQRKEIARGHLLEKLITVQEGERQRIARDLHDHLGQALSAMTMRMEAAENLAASEPDRLRERLEDAKSLALRAFEQTYELILNLRPIALDDLGLAAAIRSYAQQHLESREIAVEFAVNGKPRRLSPHLEINLFRIAQEAINNIAYQRRAIRETHLEFTDAQIQICVEDDGCGFDVTTGFELKDQGRGLGLLGMEERATFAQGICRIDSRPGAGTRVLVTIPLA
jgi:signal transduction histidine kinase